MTCLTSWLFIIMSDLWLSTINTAGLPFGWLELISWLPAHYTWTTEGHSHKPVAFDIISLNVMKIILMCQLRSHLASLSTRSLTSQCFHSDLLRKHFCSLILWLSSLCFPSASFYMWTHYRVETLMLFCPECLKHLCRFKINTHVRSVQCFCRLTGFISECWM